MSKKKNAKVAENKALIAQLHNAKATTVSEVAKELSKANVTEEVKQAVKVRDVKDFISIKTIEQLDEDKRQVIKERRNYMLDLIDERNAQVYNATMYRNDKNELILLTQKLANKFVIEYVEKLKSMTQFNAQSIMNILKTCGGAYGDKVRNALYAISYQTTATAIEKDINEVVKTATLKNKKCIYFNVLDENSRRVRYEFIKL